MIHMLQSFLYLIRSGHVDWNNRFGVKFLQTNAENYHSTGNHKWLIYKPFKNWSSENNTMPDTWHIWANSLQNPRATLSCTLREKLIHAHRLTVIPLIIFCYIVQKTKILVQGYHIGMMRIQQILITPIQYKHEDSANNNHSYSV